MNMTESNNILQYHHLTLDKFLHGTVPESFGSQPVFTKWDYTS